MFRASRVVACIIGDEVLSGRTLDTNSHQLAKLCFQAGLKLGEVRVIPDCPTTIKQTVRQWLADPQVSLIVSSGGIGPTHDDLTYAAMAEACGVHLALDQPTLDRMPHQNGDWNEGQRRMATLPTPSRVLRVSGMWQPIVVLAEDRLAILPGVPRLFTPMAEHLLQSLTTLTRLPMLRLQVKTTAMRESVLAAPLRELQAAHPQWQLGSYPHLGDNQESWVILSLIGPQTDEPQLLQLRDEMCRLFSASKL